VGEGWKSALKAAGLPETLLFHDLRRTAVTNLVASGVPKAIAKKISGHKTDSMFERYNITETDELHIAAVRAVEHRKDRETRRKAKGVRPKRWLFRCKTRRKGSSEL
jgi:hypothetical protein